MSCFPCLDWLGQSLHFLITISSSVKQEFRQNACRVPFNLMFHDYIKGFGLLWDCFIQKTEKEEMIMENRFFSPLLTTLLGQSFLLVRLKRRVDRVTTNTYKKTRNIWGVQMCHYSMWSLYIYSYNVLGNDLRSEAERKKFWCRSKKLQPIFQIQPVTYLCK